MQRSVTRHRRTQCQNHYIRLLLSKDVKKLLGYATLHPMLSLPNKHHENASGQEVAELLRERKREKSFLRLEHHEI